MEEYVYDYITSHEIHSNMVYIPIFWTNLQNHPGFTKMRATYNLLLQKALEPGLALKSGTTYFTVVQHDDGPQLDLPSGTIIFGACTGTIPLPLIYEDVTGRLLNETRLAKTVLASFIGSRTHAIREQLCGVVEGCNNIICQGKNGWSSHVSDDAASDFVRITLQSKFCLAPRGYGRSSFRFFEAMLLDTVPVYFWDDACWLPYQDMIDYSTFSVCIHQKDIHSVYQILSSISDEKYAEMVDTIKRVRYLFTLEWMCEYIVKNISL
jgi:hypothetical protein